MHSSCPITYIYRLVLKQRETSLDIRCTSESVFRTTGTSFAGSDEVASLSAEGQALFMAHPTFWPFVTGKIFRAVGSAERDGRPTPADSGTAAHSVKHTPMQTRRKIWPVATFIPCGFAFRLHGWSTRGHIPRSAFISTSFRLEYGNFSPSAPLRPA